MEQLLALDRPGMHALWDSVWGDRLYHWLRGANTGDDGAPVPSEIQKSLGHSHVMGPEFRSDEGAWAVAHKLLHKASMRLRMEHFYTAAMTVTVKYALTRQQADRLGAKQHSSGIKQAAWAMEARFKDCQDTLSLLDVLRNVWKQRPRGEDYERPFFVGVTLRELIPESEHQVSLFGDPDNRAGLSATMDKLNL